MTAARAHASLSSHDAPRKHAPMMQMSPCVRELGQVFASMLIFALLGGVAWFCGRALAVGVPGAHSKSIMGSNAVQTQGQVSAEWYQTGQEGLSVVLGIMMFCGFLGLLMMATRKTKEESIADNVEMLVSNVTDYMSERNANNDAANQEAEVRPACKRAAAAAAASAKARRH